MADGGCLDNTGFFETPTPAPNADAAERAGEEKPELLPWPCCGAPQPHLLFDILDLNKRGMHSVNCRNCGASGPECGTPNEAAIRWNRIASAGIRRAELAKDTGAVPLCAACGDFAESNKPPSPPPASVGEQNFRDLLVEALGLIEQLAMNDLQMGGKSKMQIKREFREKVKSALALPPPQPTTDTARNAAREIAEGYCDTHMWESDSDGVVSGMVAILSHHFPTSDTEVVRELVKTLHRFRKVISGYERASESHLKEVDAALEPFKKIADA